MKRLTEKQLELLKAGRHFGVVATVADDGRPQTSVVWVDTDGDRVVFNTKPSRAKGRNLRNDAHVSISVWHHDDPYKYFEVEGTAELDEDGAGEHIDELSRRYEGKPFHTPTERVIVRINATRILDHGVSD
jgi:PPOX class probable F420-dependent enzyme